MFRIPKRTHVSPPPAASRRLHNVPQPPVHPVSFRMNPPRLFRMHPSSAAIADVVHSTGREELK
jgi:hypothetical protein